MISHGNYQIARRGAGQPIQVTSSRYGSWTARPAPRLWCPCIASLREPGAAPVRHRLEFRISTTNYLIPSNNGHLFVCLRGGMIGKGATLELDGRGMVIGNVSGYPNRGGGSGPAPYPNAATVETFWAGSNAVYGETTTSPPLLDGAQYFVRIESRDSQKQERGAIIDMSIWTAGGVFHRAQVFDTLGRSTGADVGFVIGTVFDDDRAFKISINDLTEYR